MTNNHISNSDLKYTEIAVALEDYYFDTVVKFTIPTIMTFLPQNSPIVNSGKNQSSIFKNKSLENIGVGSWTSCNYIPLRVDRDKSKGRIRGIKGDKYIVLFAGGDINKPVIIEALM